MRELKRGFGTLKYLTLLDAAMPSVAMMNFFVIVEAWSSMRQLS